MLPPGVGQGKYKLQYHLSRGEWKDHLSSSNLYINTGELSLLHISSTFAPVNTHANVFFVFLPGGISKEWLHIVSANCDFEGEILPIVPMFTGLSGNTWETAKIAHESHNDVRRLCWHAGAIFVLLAE